MSAVGVMDVKRCFYFHLRAVGGRYWITGSSRSGQFVVGVEESQLQTSVEEACD